VQFQLKIAVGGWLGAAVQLPHDSWLLLPEAK
jgi:hypothetical protein